MAHTPGILFNADTGYMIDAGIIVVSPSEGCVTVMHGDGLLHTYDGENYPHVAVLPYVFNPN